MNRYYDYIRLDKLLSSQVPLSDAHHEYFFIIIHQVYELWFSAILFELDSIMETFKEGEAPVVRDGKRQPKGINEKEIGVIASKLNRIIEILKLLVAQVRVMETLTPLDFLDFRDLLLPASGYDSLQFRMIEVKLGAKLVAGRTKIFKRHSFPDKKKYSGNNFAENQLKMLKLADEGRSLFDHVGRWLERTPFVQPTGIGGWFEPAFSKLKKMPKKSSSDYRAIITMQGMFNKESYKEFLKKIAAELGFPGRKGLSHRAFQAALFIHLYRDEPILQQPHRLLESLKDVDELFTVWRNWHSSMVMRMIGTKPGTASYQRSTTRREPIYGYEYLAATRVYRFFPELDRVSTYMIPRAYRPEIPPEVAREMERLLFSDRSEKESYSREV